MRIKRGDMVLIISGNDRGETGTVQRVMLRERRVVVNGVNMIKKHQKPMQTGGRSKTQPGIIEFEGPISISNVQLVCPGCHEPTRVGYALDEGGLKSRVCKRCDAVIG